MRTGPVFSAGQVEIWSFLLDLPPREWTALASIPGHQAVASVGMRRWESRGWVERRKRPAEVGQPVDVRLTVNGRVWVRRWLSENESPSGSSASAAEIRRWAESIGLPRSGRGPLPRLLAARWNRENPDRPYARKETK